DHEIVREGICGLVGEQPGWEVCATVANGLDAVASATITMPDVVILDLRMPGLDSLEVLRKIKRALPSTEFVIFSVTDSPEAIRRVFEAGAKSFVRKGEPVALLLAAIRSVAEHKPFFTPEVNDIVFSEFVSPDGKKGAGPAKPALTAREREIVELVARGQSNKEIAALTGISLRTAETHRANAMRKLGLHSQADLVRYAIRNQMIEA
ncbi:MAG TPA: response regulator transcription factor, partial [Chthoniobacterales bacterium]